MAEFQLQIEALTPVHIGDGRELTLNIDFVKWRGTTYVLNLDRFAQWAYERDSSTQWMSQKPGDVLSGHEYALENAGLAEYQLTKVPQNRFLRSFVKTVYGESYLPGSSIKGLFRTIALWGNYSKQNQSPDLSQIKVVRDFPEDKLSDEQTWRQWRARQRNRAGRIFEDQVFGVDPYHDVFRNLRVSDSSVISPDAQALSVSSVAIFPTSNDYQPGVITDVESINPGTLVIAKCSIDKYSVTKLIVENLRWQENIKALNPSLIILMARAFAEKRIAQEIKYFEKRKSDASHVFDFYRTHLMDIYKRLDDNQFIAQIGWGTGWNSKTLNNHLSSDKERFAQLVYTFRLTKNYRNFKPGTRFPRSRHLVLESGVPVRPMGWVRVTVTEG